MQKEWIDLHRQGRLAEAEQGYREHLASAPDDVEALQLLGMLRHQRGDADEGLRMLAHAQALAPNDASIESTLASLHFRSGNHALAQRGFERALALDPNRSGAHAGIGQIALLRGDHDDAERHFRVALRVEEDPDALAGLGSLLLERGEHDAALRHLGRAADIAPGDAMIQVMLGQAFARRGTLSFARHAFENALRLHPGLHQARAMLADVLMRTGERRDAELQFRRLLAVDEFAVAAQLGIADVARAQERFDDAAMGYRAVVTADPSHAVAARALSWTLTRLKRNDDALAALDALLQRIDDQPARADRADLMIAMGRIDAAAAEWKSIAHRDPDNVQASERVATISDHLRRAEQSRDAADAEARARASYLESELARITRMLRVGDDAAARTALDALPSHPLRWHHLGHVHDRAGEFPAAVECFARSHAGFVAAMPELPEPTSALADALREPAGAAWADAPVLLLGTPGSGVERIASLLSGQPGATMMGDRIAGTARNDDLTWPRFADYIGPMSDADRVALRERYITPLRLAGYGIGETIIDWLPRWDAHLLALVRRAMPGTRLVIVEGDPRDALVNWLAFGWGAGFPCPDPLMAAAWLARARRHLHIGAELDDPHRLVVSAEDVLESPDAADRLARFVGIDGLPAGVRATLAARVDDGLPTRFPRGHWTRYRDALGDAFALLQ